MHFIDYVLSHILYVTMRFHVVANHSVYHSSNLETVV